MGTKTGNANMQPRALQFAAQFMEGILDIFVRGSSHVCSRCLVLASELPWEKVGLKEEPREALPMREHSP